MDRTEARKGDVMTQQRQSWKFAGAMVTAMAALLAPTAQAQTEVTVVNKHEAPALVRDMSHAPGATFVKEMRFTDYNAIWHYTVPIGKRLVIETIFWNSSDGKTALLFEYTTDGEKWNFEVGNPD